MSRARDLTRAALNAFPLPPAQDGDKESKGRILVIAGSRYTPGAALLTATAAMRAGAGKLRMLTVESVAVPTGLAMPEAMVIGLPEGRDGGFLPSAVESIWEQAGRVDAVVAGPGLARAQSCELIADALLDTPARLVLDAALLRSMAPPKPGRRRGSAPPVLLPHRGELASLLNCPEEEVARNPLPCGRRAAALFEANVLVKGVISHVVAPDGSAWTFRGGAPGLGVSGSGDVLAGIVGGLLARGAEPLTALLWGVLLHGEAGAALARKVGSIGFLAREIPGEIPALLAR